VVREFVDRGAAAGECGRGGCHGGDRLARGELGCRVEAVAEAHQGLDQIPQWAAAVRRDELRKRQQRGDPLGRGPELAQAGAAAQAGAHVWAQDRELLGRSLAVGERR
jgi:aspartate oxidase